MMDNIKYIPVYGSKDNILRIMEEKNLLEGVNVIPPIQFILESETGFHFEGIVENDFNDDICFLQLANRINQEEETQLLKALRTRKAPITIVEDKTVKTGDNDKDDLFDFLESDILTVSYGEASANDLTRIADTQIRVGDCPEQPAVISAARHVLSDMIPSDVSQCIVFYYPVDIDDNDDIEYAYHDVEPDVFFTVCKFDITPQNSLIINPDSNLLFISDGAIGYVIENFTPGIVAILSTEKDSEKQKMLSWFVHHDQMDGCATSITKELYNSIPPILQAVAPYENIDFIKPNNFTHNPINMMGTIIDGELLENISELLLGKPDEFDDYDDYDE